MLVLKALLMESHLPPVLGGIDPERHGLVRKSGVPHPSHVRLVPGPWLARQLDGVVMWQSTVPEAPLNELSNKRRIHATCR